MNPRPYQIETLDAVANAWKDGVSRQLVVLPTAGGKTIIFSMLPKWLRMRRPERMLVLVQAEELCFQAMKKLAAANPTLKIGLEKAEYKSTWSDDIVVASVQTLGGTEPDGNGGWKWGKRLSQMNPENFTTVVIDECFPAGTDIAGVPIESIHPGDLSLSVNHQTGEARKKKVLSTFKKRPGGMVRVHFSDGSSLCCTPEHPFYIPASSAYRPALECAGFDVVRATMLSSGHAGIQMYGMRCRDQEADEVAAGHLREGRQGLLLQSVQRNLPGENIVLDDVSHQPEVRLGQNEGQQPDGKAWRPGEGKDHAPGDWMEAVSAGREWEGPDPAAAPAGINAGVGDGSGGADERQTGLYISHLLQAGHRQSRTNGRCGGGWVFPQLACDSSERPKEDGLFSLVRVDRVEVLEQTGDGTFGGVCPDGFVYNIEIEDDHNYFANGVLVHNCHHLVAQNYHGPLRYFGVMKSEPKYNNPNKLLVGVTATPNRSDNKGLEQFFEKITYSRDIRSMIKEGWLADIRAFRVETMVSLDGVATRQGDYAIGQLEKRINTPERNNLIVDGYLKHGEGLPFIGFTCDVQHTIDLAECFRARGIKAMGISGGKGAVESDCLAYGKTARPAALEAYEKGELQGLLSCAALCEGFDCLDQETEILTGVGWRGIASVGDIQSVYGFDQCTGGIEVVPVTARTFRPRREDERMVYFNSQRINLRTTDNHDLLGKKPNWDGAYGKDFKKIKALDVATYTGQIKVPLAGEYAGFPGLPLSDDELRLIAWFMTDGGYENGRGFVISQSKEYWLEIESLLGRLGLSYTKTIRERHGYGRCPKGVPGYRSTKPLHRFRVPYGWTKGKSGWKKYLPYLDKNVSPLLHLMDRRQFSVFWAEALKGDGSNFLNGKSGWLWCDRKEQADAYTQMAVLRGFATSFAESVTRNNHTVYRISMRDAKELSLSPFGHNKSKRQHIPVEDGYTPEMVWCLTNRLGTLITRRHGKVVIVGNSPRASVALCARPTKSALLYTQMVGRSLRPFPAPEALAGYTGWIKKYAIVLDFVDNTSTNAAALNTVPSLFGLRPDFNMKGKKVMDELEEIEKLKASKPALNLSLYTDLEALRSVAEKIDLFAVPAIPPEIAKFSEYAWLTGLTAGSFQLVLPDKGVIRVQETTLGTFEVSRHLNGVKTPLKTVSTLKEAIAHADKQVPAESKILLANDASWRRMPVSDAQVGLLRRLYPELYKIHGNDAAFKDFVLKTYTKGQASSLISAKDKRGR